jgi:hypothetical protein
MGARQGTPVCELEKFGKASQPTASLVKFLPRILSPRRGNRLLLTGLNSNLRLGDRIEPKSCRSGFPP